MILVAQDDIGITRTVHVTSLQVFCFDYFDGEYVIVSLLLALGYWGSVPLDDGGACVYVSLLFQPVELKGRKVNVVELDEGLAGQ